MAVAIVSGSSGLIGSESVKFLHEKGFDVLGIDNNLRAYFFGQDGSTDWKAQEMRNHFQRYTHVSVDIRDAAAIDKIFADFGSSISMVVHCAAQPSHDWAAKEPVTDFTVNALGTLNLLEATRRFSPEATFIFTSTNKVYGDLPNYLPLVEHNTRWECDPKSKYSELGIDESMSIDQSKHSLFGASKVAADLLCQEYGRYFGLRTGIFRGGCLTGPAHSGAELHGFLAYLVKCQLMQREYTIFGYKGKQVRDNIHSLDLVNAFWQFHLNPNPGRVYNIGGSRKSNCSVLEAISMVREMTELDLIHTLSDKAREGDHIWWISDTGRFQTDYPAWKQQYGMDAILREIVDATAERHHIKIH